MASAKYQTLNWHVYHDIVRLIASGDFPAGSRLDEQQIAKQLGVSRTPIREAIAKLMKDGLVEHRPYRGNFVRLFTEKEVFDLYEVRKGLESIAVRLAIPNLTEEAISELRNLLAMVEAALKANDLDAYGLADQQFHDKIAELTGNQTLIAMLEQLGGQVQLIRTMANQDPTIVEITAMERPGIVDAMVAGDVDTATRLMEEHIELVQHNRTRALKSPTQSTHDGEIRR